MSDNSIKDTTQTYKLGDFEGPLDLLLFLIKKNEVNIYDIPISKITAQYLGYLEYNSEINLDNLTEFYVMATTLLYVKSCMLLPVDFDLSDEIEDPRQELVVKLIEYQKYKKLGELISEKEKDFEWEVERKKTQLVLPFNDDRLWEEIAIWDLVKYFSSIISSLSTDKIVDFYEEFTINEKITLINEYLESKKEFPFFDLIKNSHSIMEVICSFIAMLELAKLRNIRIYQNKLFDEVIIRKVENDR